MTNTLIGTTKPPRYGAAVIDHVLALFSLFAAGNYLGQRFSTSDSSTENTIVGLSVLVVYFLYYFVFEWLFSATPGKLFTGLTIRKINGSKCDAKAALIRTLTRLVEVNPLLLGGLPAAVIVRCSKRRQRWGDKLAETVVVESGRVS